MSNNAPFLGTLNGTRHYMGNYDKINIFVPDKLFEDLHEDAKSFEIRKRNGDLNFNRFLSILIVGYYEQYITEFNRTLEETRRLLSGRESLDEHDVNDIAALIVSEIIYPKNSKKKGRRSKRISLKPTAETESILLSVMNNLNGDTISQYLCRMLLSYSSKPFTERERIVFNAKYGFLQEAIVKTETISFTLNNNSREVHYILPYKIAVGREELFNYVLGQEFNPFLGKDEAVAYRLNRMTNLAHVNKTIRFENVIEKHLEMMLKHGPQYGINDDEQKVVRLSNRAERSYNRIYYGRPEPDRINREVKGYADYYFSCSSDQLFLYFRRFDDVEVIAPISLRNKMIKFHRDALNKYRETIDE